MRHLTQQDEQGTQAVPVHAPVSAGSDIDRAWRVADATVGAVFRLGFKFRFAGGEHIPAQGGALLAYNHVSVLDPIAVAMAASRRRRSVHFLAVADVFDRPILGWVLRATQQIPLRRGMGDWKAIQEVAGAIRAGALGGMSPEGTVGDGSVIQPGQKGAARIALSARAPVIPIGVWGTQSRWPKDGPRLGPPLRPVVVVVVGAPIPPEGDPRSKPDVRAMTDRIMAGIAEAATEARARHA